MKKTIKIINLGIAALLVAVAFAIPTQAQDDPLVAECNGLYDKYLTAREKKDAVIELEAAKVYLSKCVGKNEEYDKYLKSRVEKIEKAVLQANFKDAFTKAQLLASNKTAPSDPKVFADVYKHGKQILAQEPDNLDVMMKLAITGFYAEGKKEKAHRADAETYSKMAITKIEAGQVPPDKKNAAGQAISPWDPFTGKEDTLSWLNYTLGTVTKETNPKESVKYFYKVTKIEAKLKTDASTYYQIASYYQSEYLKKVEEVKVKCPEGAPDSDECKALDNDVNARMDRWADALARAVSYSTNKAEKDAWTKTLTEIFQQRYNKPEAVNDYVANIQKTPMPDPDSELKPAPIMEVTTATTTNTTGAITTMTTTETSLGPTTNGTDSSQSNGKAATATKVTTKANAKSAHKTKGRGKRP